MELDPIEQYLDQAVEALRKTSRDPTQEALLYLGTLNDAYPSILVYDPFLTDSAKIHLLYLTQETRKQPYGAIAMPSASAAGHALSHSRGTVTRDRILLRITRWISLVRRVHDTGSVQFAGNLYAIHGEPATLTDAIRYDAEYMRLIEQAASNHNDPQTQQAARAAVAFIDNNAAKGADSLAPIDSNSRRLIAANTLNSKADESGDYFGLYCENKRSDEETQLPEKSPSLKFEHGKFPCSNFRLGDLPSSNFEHGDSDSSSSIYITTTTKPQNSNFDSRKKALEALQWPPSLDDNMRRLVHRTLIEAIDAEHHQDILHALAHKALDKDDPLRSPVTYVLGCCQRIRAGTFHPVGPPCIPPEIKPSEPSRSTVASNLRGEMRDLERMIKREKVEGTREVLEQQVEQLRQRLNERSMQNAADNTDEL